MKRTRKATPSAIHYAERRAKALRLRSLRMTYQQIADELYNGNRGQCYRDIQKGIDDLPREAAEHVRVQELELLDEMSRGLIPKARKGDDKAVQGMLRIMDRRAKYLGLDTPVQIDTNAGPLTVVFDPILQVDGMAEPQVVVDPEGL